MSTTAKAEQARSHARAALLAYRASCEGADPDDLAAIGDLLTDLLHLAKAIGDEQLGGDRWVIQPAGLTERALRHYAAEAMS